MQLPIITGSLNRIDLNAYVLSMEDNLKQLLGKWVILRNECKEIVQKVLNDKSQLSILANDTRDKLYFSSAKTLIPLQNLIFESMETLIQLENDRTSLLDEIVTQANQMKASSSPDDFRSSWSFYARLIDQVKQQQLLESNIIKEVTKSSSGKPTFISISIQGSK
jgi:hypothetical protein